MVAYVALLGLLFESSFGVLVNSTFAMTAQYTRHNLTETMSVVSKIPNTENPTLSDTSLDFWVGTSESISGVLVEYIFEKKDTLEIQTGSYLFTGASITDKSGVNIALSGPSVNTMEVLISNLENGYYTFKMDSGTGETREDYGGSPDNIISLDFTISGDYSHTIEPPILADTCKNGWVWGQLSNQITDSTSGLCQVGETVGNFHEVANWNSTNYTWSCNGISWGNCSAQDINTYGYWYGYGWGSSSSSSSWGGRGLPQIHDLSANNPICSNQQNLPVDVYMSGMTLGDKLEYTLTSPDVSQGSITGTVVFDIFTPYQNIWDGITKYPLSIPLIPTFDSFSGEVLELTVTMRDQKGNSNSIDGYKFLTFGSSQSCENQDLEPKVLSLSSTGIIHPNSPKFSFDYVLSETVWTGSYLVARIWHSDDSGFVNRVETSVVKKIPADGVSLTGTIVMDLMWAFEPYSHQDIAYELGFEHNELEYGTPLVQLTAFDQNPISGKLEAPLFTIDERSDWKNKHYYQAWESVNLSYTWVITGNSLKVYLIGASENQEVYETDAHARDSVSEEVAESASWTATGQISFLVPSLWIGNYTIKMTQSSGTIVSPFGFEPRGAYETDTMINIVDELESDYYFELQGIRDFYCMDRNMARVVAPWVPQTCPYKQFSKSWAVLRLDLSGFTYPELSPYDDDLSGKWSLDYEVLVNDAVYTTGSIDVVTLESLWIPYTPVGTQGEGLRVALRLTDWHHKVYSTWSDTITIDNEFPEIEGTVSGIDAEHFLLSMTGSDMSPLSWYWFQQEIGSGYSWSYLSLSSVFATWTELEVGTWLSRYYGVWMDSAENYTTIALDLPRAPSPVTHLAMTGITQTWATMIWTASTGSVDGYDIYLNGAKIANMWSGSTVFSFTGLIQDFQYVGGVKSKNGFLVSSLQTVDFQTTSLDTVLAVDVEPICMEWNVGGYMWTQVYRTDAYSWNDYHYGYQIPSNNHADFHFPSLKPWTYQYIIDTGACGRIDGTFTQRDILQTINLTRGAEKYIHTLVRENTLTGRVVSSYYIDLSTLDNDWNKSRFEYVSAGTGKILKMLDEPYLATIRDTNTRTSKSIVWVYDGETKISDTSLLQSSTYGTGDSLTFVVNDGNVFAWTANIPSWYLYLYNADTNASVGGGYIRNGKFNMLWLPNGNYRLQGYSYDYRFGNIEENFVLNTSIVDKSLNFPQYNASVKASFNKSEVFPATRVALKILPNGHDTWTLSFESGSALIEQAKYRVIDNSGTTIDSWVLDLSSTKSFSWLINATITVDLELKWSLSPDYNYLYATFSDLTVSVPITHVSLNAPSIVKVWEAFQVSGRVSKLASYDILYNGTVTATGTTTNGVFTTPLSFPTAGSGTLVVRDNSEWISSNGTPIVISSSLPVLSWYTIKIGGTPRIEANDPIIRNFSARVHGNLKINSSVEVSANFSQAIPDSIRYYIWGIALTGGLLEAETYVGFGIKDVMVEYTVGRTTYTQIIARMVILIDPSGSIYNKTDNSKIANMEASLYYLGDANKNPILATWGVDQPLLSSYKVTGYAPSALTTALNYCSESGKTCTWYKYDSTGYGEEPNSQITDAEWRFSWVTPSGYYYVAFHDVDGNTNGLYADFTSPVVFIPPEVTDLNVGTNYASGYVQTENSTNYDRSRTWNGSTWGSWSYTCKNNYTWATCTTLPNSTSSSSGGFSTSSSSSSGWWGGGSYSYSTTCISIDLVCTAWVWKKISGKTCTGWNLGKTCQIIGTGKTASGSTTGTGKTATGTPSKTQTGTKNTRSDVGSSEIENLFDFTDIDSDIAETWSINGSWEGGGGSWALTDIETSFAKDYIKLLLDQWIVAWYSDGTFHPESTATRLEYLKMVLRAKGVSYETIDTTPLPFVDVDKKSWWAKVVAKWLELWVISDKSAFFRPNAPISREEAVKMLLKVFGENLIDVNTCDFDDVSGWSMKYVQRAKELGIVSWSEEGGKFLFHPTRNISRAEVSKIIVKMMDVFAKTE